MRLARIVTCALAVIGAYFLVLRAAFMAKLEGDAYAYASQIVGALIAGAAIAHLETRGARPRYEALIAGMLGTATVAVVAFASARTYSWAPVRSAHPAVLALATIVATGVASHVGAWLFGARAGSTAWLVVFAGAVSACMVFLGGRVAYAAGLVSLTVASATIASCVCAAIAAFATQWVVLAHRPVACASGILVAMGVYVLGVVLNGTPLDNTLVLCLPIIASLVGAQAAAVLRPKPVDF